MKISKSQSLKAALGIPFALLLFVIASIYLPAMFNAPEVDFLYSAYSNDQIPETKYSVQDGRLMADSLSSPNAEKFETKLYRHDVQTNQSRQISFEDAARLQLSGYTLSPDGFEIVTGRKNKGMLPFNMISPDSTFFYLKGHYRSTKLKLETVGKTLEKFHFLGWIKE